MKSVDTIRKWANGLRGAWIDTKDNSIIVTTCDDMPPSMDCVSLREHVNGILDEIEREVADMVPLPVDADGVPIHVGDVMETDNGIREVDVLQKSSRKWSVGLVPVGSGAFSGAFSWHDAETLHHHHAPTVEDVLREFAAQVTNGQHIHGAIEIEQAIAECAAMLRLAGEDA